MAIVLGFYALYVASLAALLVAGIVLCRQASSRGPHLRDGD